MTGLQDRLRPSFGAHRFGLERLAREAQTLTRLVQHPAILPVEHIGAHKDGFYSAMPWIHGESLRTYLDREGPRPIGSIAS